MNANELLILISKQWCTLSNLMKLLGCALEVKNDIKTKLINEEYYIPGNNLPMQEVIDLLKIDINKLEKIIELNK